MTASGRLQFNHCSTTPGKTKLRSFPWWSGRTVLTWLNTTPPELTWRTRADSHASLNPRQMISPHGTDLELYVVAGVGSL
jgi:hypothetical protein